MNLLFLLNSVEPKEDSAEIEPEAKSKGNEGKLSRNIYYTFDFLGSNILYNSFCPYGTMSVTLYACHKVRVF